MWQDIFVSLIAVGAAAILGRRYFRKKTGAAPTCENCAQGEAHTGPRS